MHSNECQGYWGALWGRTAAEGRSCGQDEVLMQQGQGSNGNAASARSLTHALEI